MVPEVGLTRRVPIAYFIDRGVIDFNVCVRSQFGWHFDWHAKSELTRDPLFPAPRTPTSVCACPLLKDRLHFPTPLPPLTLFHPHTSPLSLYQNTDAGIEISMLEFKMSSDMHVEHMDLFFNARDRSTMRNENISFTKCVNLLIVELTNLLIVVKVLYYIYNHHLHILLTTFVSKRF